MRRFLLTATGALVALALLVWLVSCDSAGSREAEGGVAPGAVPPTANASGESGDTAPSGTEPGLVEPEVVSFGGRGRHLAVVVRNTSAREIVRGRVLITALDRRNRPLMATIGRPDSKCCTILGLAPGGDYGLYVDLPGRVADVARVLVRFVEIETGPRRSARLQVTDAELHRTVDDAVVTATLRVHGSAGPYAIGQAFLVDAAGDLQAVISGQFYCFRAGAEHRLRMQLTRTVPIGTRIEQVVAHPVPEGEDIAVDATCQTPTRR